MDEFRGSWCQYEVLLRILDGHPYQAEQKGGHVCCGYTKVIMTSNVDPESWYSRTNIPDQGPLFRRITEIYYVTEPLYSDIETFDVRKQPVKYFSIFYPPALAGPSRDDGEHSDYSNKEYHAKQGEGGITRFSRQGFDSDDDTAVQQLALLSDK